MATIRSLFWFVIFLASTFVFTVLFEHGPKDFKANAKKEIELLKNYVKKPERKADDSDKTE